MIRHLVDNIFGIDITGPPMLLYQGTLRRLVDAAFASLLMNYTDRKAAGEMEHVNAKLECAFALAYPLRPIGDLQLLASIVSSNHAVCNLGLKATKTIPMPMTVPMTLTLTHDPTNNPPYDPNPNPNRNSNPNPTHKTSDLVHAQS